MIKSLIPHRLPFLLVGEVNEFTKNENSYYLKAHYKVDLKELGLEKLDKLPSSYVLEGLGQCCNIISVLYERDLISNLSKNRKKYDEYNEPLLGLLANVDIELLDDVNNLSTIYYHITQSFSQSNFSIFEVRAECNHKNIAIGKLIGSKIQFHEKRGER